MKKSKIRKKKRKAKMLGAIIVASFLIWVAILLWFAYYLHKKEKSRYIDDRGYERDGFGKLIHRKLAYKHLYNYPEYPAQFRYYVVHHIDGDKLNNDIDNLEILTPTEHKRVHRGFL